MTFNNWFDAYLRDNPGINPQGLESSCEAAWNAGQDEIRKVVHQWGVDNGLTK